MPQLYFHVEAPGVNILKTVQDETVFGLLDELDLIRYFKNSVYILNSFSAYSQYDDGIGTPTMTKNRCDVDVEFIMDKSQVPWPDDTPYNTPAYGLRSTYKGNHTPILIDTAAGISIEHYTVACALHMNFKLTFRTFDDACKAFDTIKTKYTGSLLHKPFDLVFSYPVSMGMYKYLMAVYKAKTDYQSKTLLDYINDMKKTQISFDVRKSQIECTDADTELMIRCRQLNSMAQMTMDQKEPEVRREEKLPVSYSINFEYVIQFGRPNLVVVNTPVSVDNTVLPYGEFENNIINAHHNPYVGGMYQEFICTEFMKRSFGNFNQSHELVRIPMYDDWSCSDAQYKEFGYRPFLIAHFTLDGATSTINLKLLDDVVMHPVVQDILSQTGNDVFKYGGIFNIGVFAGDLKLGPSLLNLDSDLNLTVTSSRPDKVYHFVISESTNIQIMDPSWNDLLIKYRYFFPMTIERNIQHFVKHKYLKVETDNTLFTLISRLEKKGLLKALLSTMISLGEYTNEIYAYTQNPSQLADFMCLTMSDRKDYTVPTGTDATSVMIQTYYSSYTSVEGRSLLVAFLEQCLISGYITLDALPTQYLDINQKIWPFYSPGEGGFYGFNTPLRVCTYNIRVE